MLDTGEPGQCPKDTGFWQENLEPDSAPAWLPHPAWARPRSQQLQAPSGSAEDGRRAEAGAGGDPQLGLREGRRACPGIAPVSEDGHCTPHSHTPALLGSRCQLVTLLSF